MSSRDFDVSTIGELLGVLTPTTHGPLEDVATLEKSVGGAEVNVAIGLARLGCTVTWVGHVGADPFGREGLRTLQREGVDTSHARIDDAAPTGLYVKELADPEEAGAFYYRAGSAASRMTFADIDVDHMLSCRILHLTGVTPMISASCEDLVRRIAALARERAIPISFDANIRPRLLRDRSPIVLLAPLIEAARLIFASTAEARILFGTDDPDALAQRLADGRQATIVVHDATVATVVPPEGAIVCREAKQLPVVDPVGAGDAFVAGYLCGWLRGLPDDHALDLAHTCAAEVVGVRGDHAGRPDVVVTVDHSLVKERP